MMHAIISARELFDHVKMVAHATITNSRAIPILRCIKLAADGDKTTATATNLEIVAEATTVATVEAAGEAVVPAEPLTGVLTGITGDLEIIADETEVVLKHGRSRFRLPALPVEDFPDPLGVPGDIEGVGLSAADLARFTSASLLTAVDDRIYLAGVLVHAEDGHLTVTGTDGAALLHDAVDAVYRGPDVIVHFDTIKMLGRLFGKSGATMRTNGKLIEFSSDSVRLVSKLIDSTYPDYTRIIPVQVPIAGVTVASAEIAAAFARFAAFRTGKNELQCAVLTWDADAAPGELHLTLNRSQAGEGEVIITAETTGAGRTGVGVNKMSGLVLLNCRNRILRVDDAPDLTRLNKARARRGKAALLPARTVRVDLSRPIAQAMRRGSGADRAAVAAHVVRGHLKIRRTGPFWWSPHTRGGEGMGMPDYSVTASKPGVGGRMVRRAMRAEGIAR